MIDSVIIEVVENIEEMAKNLERHLKINTPVIHPERNGIQESNLTFHFAHQCLIKDWLIYPEASNFTIADRGELCARVDLHVIVEGKFILTVEAKKFHDTTSANGLIADFQRAESINYDHDFKNLPHYALLLAISEKQDWEDWWRDSQNWDNNSNTWQHLAKILESEGMVRSSYVIDDDIKKHYLLYGIKQVR